MHQPLSVCFKTYSDCNFIWVNLTATGSRGCTPHPSLLLPPARLVSASSTLQASLGKIMPLASPRLVTAFYLSRWSACNKPSIISILGSQTNLFNHILVWGILQRQVNCISDIFHQSWCKVEQFMSLQLPIAQTPDWRHLALILWKKHETWVGQSRQALTQTPLTGGATGRQRDTWGPSR